MTIIEKKGVSLQIKFENANGKNFFNSEVVSKANWR